MHLKQKARKSIEDCSSSNRTAAERSYNKHVFGKNDCSNAMRNRRSQKEADDEGTLSLHLQYCNLSNQSSSKACVGGYWEERVALFIVHRNRACRSSQMRRITFRQEQKSGRKWVGEDNCRICTV